MDIITIVETSKPSDFFVSRLREVIMSSRLKKCERLAFQRAEQSAIEEVSQYFIKREKEIEEEALDLYKEVLWKYYDKYFDEYTEKLLRYGG